MKNFFGGIILFAGLGILIGSLKEFSYGIPIWPYGVIILVLISSGSKMIITGFIDDAQTKSKKEFRGELEKLKDEMEYENSNNFQKRKNLSDDELYKEACEIVMNAGKASTSFLQRKLGIGYAQSARLIDRLEERGVIGSGSGAEPRDILVKQEK